MNKMLPKRFTNIIVIMCLVLTMTSGFGQVFAYTTQDNWQAVEKAGFSEGYAYDTCVDIYNGIIYVAYLDGAKGYSVTVKRYNGTTWQTVGTAGFSDKAINLSLKVNNGTPYVAYQSVNSSFKATVMKFDGANWVNVGTTGFTTVAANFLSFSVSNDVPYIAYLDTVTVGTVTTKKASVMKYDGTAWVYVGAQMFTSGATEETSLFVDNGTPYFAYKDFTSKKQTVMKFNGTAWVVVGAEGFSAGEAYYCSLYVVNGTPYVAYADSTKYSAATVMKFDGTSWVTIGTTGFTPAAAYEISLFVDNSDVYVAYKDGANGAKASVMKFNGSAWNAVGTSNFSTGIADNTSICVYQGSIYVIYTDYANGCKATVMNMGGVAEIVKTPVTYKSATAQKSTETNIVSIRNFGVVNNNFEDATVTIAMAICSADTNKIIALKVLKDYVILGGITNTIPAFTYADPIEDDSLVFKAYVVDSFSGLVPAGESYSVNVDNVAPPIEAKYEVESLSVSSTPAITTTADASCSNGSYRLLSATAVGNYVELSVDVAKAGTYSVYLGHKSYTSRGIAQLTVDGVNVGNPIDYYNSATTYYNTSSNDKFIGDVTISTPGIKIFKFTITGKNAASPSYSLFMDYIRIKSK